MLPFAALASLRGIAARGGLRAASAASALGAPAASAWAAPRRAVGTSAPAAAAASAPEHQQSAEEPRLPQRGEARKLNLCSAVNEALHVALEADDSACVFGEDVAFGGVFRATVGLQERFGAERVFNTPLSEQGIVGFGIGLAAAGGTAIAEIQFADYIFPAFDQLVNEAAKMRYRSGGLFSCSGLTVRAPCGAVGHGGHYHSQSPESYFAAVPGLKVVMPSSPAEAKGLLLACIREPDPCVFFEPKMLYRTAVEDVPAGDYTIPLGVARTLSEGSDVTLVGWGAQVLVLAQAAKAAAALPRPISCEVIDLRTLMPWDAKAVAASVSKTGRLIVSHEAPLTGHFGAEITARIAERCFARLEAPPLRICGADTPFPLVYEPLYLPGVERVLEAIKASAEY
ncbi:2-oxoisovalerate dehydrogenase subunit beta mitochondrial-like [Raphidocelis subcapitata]|uniref:3-methyl-2-oxobutanoate dehydrogenase (2-methylpropanoyl-transferring) n=1 Tax=Raphidocelis subcapitata TaxID=307507 RepID=A0A2V0PD32_9CHLO|nr:2-oxoisovalerate dehydrogenase subunit beta mitochondrial-like [Raphidocelis subcapitata]|eukprot:GBF97429.1 2-oxoisovalerate dehydrogenase subunit beta mitochondrial-like [Raphidocelis subcapitata]